MKKMTSPLCVRFMYFVQLTVKI